MIIWWWPWHDDNGEEENSGALDAELSLKKAISSLYADGTSVLWSTYFIRTSKRLRKNTAQVPGGVFFVTADHSQDERPAQGEPLSMVCFQAAFSRAKAIFEQVCPEGEFLKKPEELAKAHAALQRIGDDDDDSDLEGLDFDESLYMDDSDGWHSVDTFVPLQNPV